jgi:LuxR family transcriptional activator of bioluminescence operon
MADLIKKVTPRELVADPLSDRENECLSLAAHGKTLDEIATIMSLSERTVRFHLGKVCEKLGATNRVHAIARASYLGLLGPVH